MSSIFALTIPLKPSIDFQRLGFLLLGSGLLCLLYADPPYLLGIITVLWALSALRSLMQFAKPHAQLQCIKFQNGHWILQEGEQSATMYECLHVRVDTGFFMLLHFSSPSRSRFIVVFYDQMSKDELRTLQILHTIL